MADESYSRSPELRPEQEPASRGIRDVEQDLLHASGGMRPRASGEHSSLRGASRDPEVVWKEPVRPPAVVFEEPDPFSSQTFRSSGAVRSRERVMGNASPFAPEPAAARVGPETLLEIRERYKNGDRSGAFNLLEQFLQVYPTHEPASRLYRALRAQRKAQGASGHIDRAALLAAATEAATPEERHELRQALAGSHAGTPPQAVERKSPQTHWSEPSEGASEGPSGRVTAHEVVAPVEIPVMPDPAPIAVPQPFVPQLQLTFEEEITDAGTRLSPLLADPQAASSPLSFERRLSFEPSRPPTHLTLGRDRGQEPGPQGRASESLTLGQAMNAESGDGAASNEEQLGLSDYDGSSEALPFALVPDLMSTDQLPALTFQSDPEPMGSDSGPSDAESYAPTYDEANDAAEAASGLHFAWENAEAELETQQPFGVMASELNFELETTNPRAQTLAETALSEESAAVGPADSNHSEADADADGDGGYYRDRDPLEAEVAIRVPALGLDGKFSDQDDLSEFNTLRDSVIVFSNEDVHSEETTGWSVVDVIAAEQLVNPDADAVLSGATRPPGAEEEEEEPLAEVSVWDVEPSWDGESAESGEPRVEAVASDAVTREAATPDQGLEAAAAVAIPDLQVERGTEAALFSGTESDSGTVFGGDSLLGHTGLSFDGPDAGDAQSSAFDSALESAFESAPESAPDALPESALESALNASPESAREAWEGSEHDGAAASDASPGDALAESQDAPDGPAAAATAVTARSVERTIATPHEPRSSPWTRAFWGSPELDSPSSSGVHIAGHAKSIPPISLDTGPIQEVELGSEYSQLSSLEALELPSAGSNVGVGAATEMRVPPAAPPAPRPLESSSVLAINLEVLMETRFLFTVEERLLLCQVNGVRTLQELIQLRGELGQDHVLPFLKSLLEEGSLYQVETAQ